LSNLAEETRLEMAALLKRCTSSALHSNPRPRSALLLLRPLSVGRFALLRFAFGQKIWHTIFFSSKANFKIFPKLLLRRGASQSLKSWRVTVHPRYPAWSI